MKRNYLSAAGTLCLLLNLSSTVLGADLFSPARTNALRLPSVPLVSVDPYFSIWSP